MTQSQGQKNVLLIFGSIFGFLLITGVGYYAGYSFTWQNFSHLPKIGADPRSMKIVVAKKDIEAGQVIDFESVEEKHDVLPIIATDAYSFAADVYGHKAKWGMHKGDYLSHHDMEPKEQ